MMDPEKLFGNDLQLVDRVGGLDLLSDNFNDLDLARGNENMVQVLTLRLKVRKGELERLGWPDYGSRLHELIGEPNNARTHVKLMAYARQAIERDPRVAEIQEIRTQVFSGERSGVRLYMDILLIDQPTPLSLFFDLNLEAL